MTDLELEDLHKHSSNNRASIKKGAKAGCFYCLEIFPKEDVREYTLPKGNGDAVCPRCNVDSVISQSHFASLAELKKALLEMQNYWFKVKP